MLRVSPITSSLLRRTLLESRLERPLMDQRTSYTFSVMAVSIPSSLVDLLAESTRRVKDSNGVLGGEEAPTVFLTAVVQQEWKANQNPTCPVFIAATLPAWTRVQVKSDLLRSSLCYDHLSKERSPRGLNRKQGGLPHCKVIDVQPLGQDSCV